MNGVRRLCNLVLQCYRRLSHEKGIFYGLQNVYVQRTLLKVQFPEYGSCDLKQSTLRQSRIMIGYEGRQRLRLEHQALPLEQCYIYRQQYHL